MEKEWNGHYGEILTSVGETDVIQCEKCEYAHKIPLPEQKKWKEFYEDGFYEQNEKSTYLEETEKDKEYREILHEDKYLNIIRLKDLGTSPSILDVGSGGGSLLAYFQEKGWEVQGVELSKIAYKFAISRSRPTLNLSIERFLSSTIEKRYDVVHLRAVLDNILAPLEIINRIREKCIKEDGILIIDTGNDYNDLQKCICLALGEREWWVEGDTLNFFNPQSIEKLLMKACFDVIHKESTFPLEVFVLMGENYIGNSNSKVGKEIHEKRVLFERNLRKANMIDVKRRLYTALANSGFGRHIIIYCTPTK